MKIQKSMLNAIQANMSKLMSEDDLFGNLLAEKLKKLPFEINLQAKTEIDNMMFKYFMMSHNRGKRPVQAQQFNVFLNQMSPLIATSLTPTPRCTSNTAISLPASPAFAIIFHSYKHKIPSCNTQ